MDEEMQRQDTRNVYAISYTGTATVAPANGTYLP